MDERVSSLRDHGITTLGGVPAIHVRVPVHRKLPWVSCRVHVR